MKEYKKLIIFCILICISLLMAACAHTSEQNSLDISTSDNSSALNNSQYETFEQIHETTTEEPLIADSVIFSFPEDMAITDIYLNVKKGGWVVSHSGFIMAGDSLWREFYDKVSKGEPANVLIAKYTEFDPENKSPEYIERYEKEYPRLLLTEISYDGELFTQMTFNFREGELDSQARYKYIISYDGPPVGGGDPKYGHEEVYYLVNDSTVTYEQIVYSYFMANAGIPDVYAAYTLRSEYKDEYTDRIPKE